MNDYVCIWLDTDKEGRLADNHNVQGLPHLEILDSRGKKLAQMMGYQTPAAVRAALAKHKPAAQPPARRPARRGNQRQPSRRGNAAGTMNAQQMQRELVRLRQQLARLQRQQAEQAKILKEILQRLKDR